MKKIQEEVILVLMKLMSNVGKPFVTGTEYGMESLSSQSAQQGCTADPVVPPGERIGKMFLFTRLHLKPN